MRLYRYADYCFMTPSPRGSDDGELRYPEWFLAFVADRAVRKPSPHTAKAYRQDFVAIATLLAGGPARVAQLTPVAITKDAMQIDRDSVSLIRACRCTVVTACEQVASINLEKWATVAGRVQQFR